MREQIMDLLASEHSGKGVMVFGSDLGKHRPVRLAEQINKIHFGRGQGLADALGFPMLLEFDKEEVVAQLGLGNGGRIAGQMLVDEPELPVVGVASAVGVVAQSQEIGEPGHRLIRVVIIDGVGVIAGRGPNAWRRGRPGSPLALLSLKASLRTAVRLVVEIAGG